MKFAVLVVLFALALGAQSSVIVPHPLAYTAVHGPHVVSVAHPPAAVAVHAAVHAAPIHVVSHPIVHAAHTIVAAPVVHAAPAVVTVAAAEGTYVAKTRGAVHVAPLPGHANSASSVNLEPAPGTV